MLRLIVGTFLIIVSIVSGASAAEPSLITENMISAQYEKMEQVLNHGEGAMETIHVLHNLISDKARFKLTVSNPQMAGGSKSPVMEMDKQAYINSYIQGPHYIEDYNIEIKTLEFTPGRNAHEAYTLDVMTERGKVANEMNNRKPFVSRTTCRTKHEIHQGRLRAVAGQCHTDISFEEDV